MEVEAWATVVGINRIMTSDPQREGWDIPRSHVRGGTTRFTSKGEEEARMSPEFETQGFSYP